jgi:hypothetical protein
MEKNAAQHSDGPKRSGGFAISFHRYYKEMGPRIFTTIYQRHDFNLTMMFVTSKKKYDVYHDWSEDGEKEKKNQFLGSWLPGGREENRIYFLVFGCLYLRSRLLAGWIGI